jgi:hypothetical protein
LFPQASVVDHKVAAEVEFVALRDDLVSLRHALAAEQVRMPWAAAAACFCAPGVPWHAAGRGSSVADARRRCPAAAAAAAQDEQRRFLDDQLAETSAEVARRVTGLQVGLLASGSKLAPPCAWPACAW